MSRGFKAEAGAGVASPTTLTLMRSSASAFLSVSSTCWSESVGSMRQFTIARADCGSALLACPPSRRVATQVVRISAL